MVALFRSTLVINALLYIALIVLPIYDSFWLSETELDVLSYIGFNAMVKFPDMLLWVFVIAWFFAAVGMYFFMAWARTLFLVWIVFSTLTVMVGGMQVQTAMEAILSDAGNIIDGTILALAYFSSLSGRFLKSRSKEVTQ